MSGGTTRANIAALARTGQLGRLDLVLLRLPAEPVAPGLDAGRPALEAGDLVVEGALQSGKVPHERVVGGEEARFRTAPASMCKILII